MKRIEAIIRPEKTNIVKAALEELGYSGMTVTEVKGHGIQKGITEVWRGRVFKVDLLPKVKMEMIVPDADVDKLVQAIADEAKTGNIGDGKIFVSSIDNVMRIRTGESGEKAV
ncbi:MAG: P-II family nitrogen regulator [Candidatus Brocadiales bacterium]